ncbi:hypothetical protein [Lachnotalea glycerini]|nr:hypothetical protein [Lachnotalea glycerini]
MKELELAKKLAVLAKIYQMELITEAEYATAKNQILNSYNVVSFMNM